MGDISLAVVVVVQDAVHDPRRARPAFAAAGTGPVPIQFVDNRLNERLLNVRGRFFRILCHVVAAVETNGFRSERRERDSTVRADDFDQSSLAHAAKHQTPAPCTPLSCTKLAVTVSSAG